MITLRRPAIILTLALFTAACGGGSSATTTPNGTQSASQPAATEGTPTDQPAATPTEGTAETPAPSQGGGGGTITGEACDQLTVAEVGSTLGKSGVSIEMNTPGDVSYCIYSADGSSVVATTLMKHGGHDAFPIWKAGAGVQDVSGLGDDAVWDPASAALLVLKGDAIFSITAGNGEEQESQRLEWSKALAQVALGRM